MTTNPRNGVFPTNAILMVPNTCVPPTGFSQECTLNCVYIKGIPTACTNPGTCTGAATHTHGADGVHSHTSVSGTAHTHTGVSGGPSTTANTWCCPALATPKATSTHTHTVTSASTSPAGTVACGTSHTHNTVCNQLAHRTVSFYKKTATLIQMRNSVLPLNTMVFFAGTTVPCGYTADCTYHGKHVKGIAASPGCNVGTSCHTHSCSSHTHAISLASHSHTASSVGGGASLNRRDNCSAAPVAAGAHTHTGSTFTFGSNTGCNPTSSAGGCHTHGSKSNEVAYKTLNLITSSAIKMRRPSIEKDVVVLWNCPVACIPENYGVSDGTNCTINMLGLYPKGSCSPGCTGGCNAHTHCSGGASHNHTSTIIHNHGLSGSVGTSSGTSQGTNVNPVPFASTTHTHSGSGSSASSGPATTTSSDAFAHTHPSKNHEPVGVTVAFIQRF